jgi:TonB family protein
MVSILGHLVVGMLAVGTAHADEPKQEGDLEDMLDNIPTIETPKKKDVKPKVNWQLDYQSYSRKCHEAVMPHFKPPKSVRKKNPDIELEVLVSVDLKGNVLGAGVGSRTGVKAFDKAAIKALNKAGQLPPPPAGWNVEKDRVILTFRPR